MSSTALLFFVPAAFSLLLTAVLCFRGLAGSYRWFVFYLLVYTLLGLAGALLYRQPNVYGWFYFSTAVFTWLAPLLAGMEAYRKVMRNHPGIARFGTKVLSVAAVIAFCIATFTWVLQNDLPGGDLLRLGISIERVVRSALALYWMAIIAFLIWYPVSLNRNTVVHCGLFALYFCLSTVWLLAYTVMPPQFREFMNTSRLIIVLVCHAGWVLLLTRAGETQMVRIGHRWDRSAETKLLANLDALNEQLMSSARVK